MTVFRLERRNPALRLTGGVDRLFSDFLGDVSPGFGLLPLGRQTFPVFNVWEDEGNLYAEAEIPGLKMDDLEVLVMGDELTVKGERKDIEKQDVTYHLRERGVGEFSRVLSLPMEVDPEKVQATLRDGVLSITMPKAQNMLPRKIEVK